MKIYHNPRCSKSRAGLQHMQEKGVEVEIIDYIKNPLTIDELTELFKKLDKLPEEMIRKHEDLYKSDYKGKEFTNKEWIKIIAENPRLLHRPIIVKGNTAIWGQPVDEIDKLL